MNAPANSVNNDIDDRSDSDQSDVMDEPVPSTPVVSSTGRVKGGGLKDRRYKDIWRDAGMEAVASWHTGNNDNWPPRNDNGDLPVWVSEGSRRHLAKQCKP